MALADMAKAVERIIGAIAHHERIAIHGDYDVDGITSTVILRRALELLGAQCHPLHPGAAARWLRSAAGGRRSAPRRGGRADHVGRLRHPRRRCAPRARVNCGVDLIITDHHEPDGELPSAFAVINPKRADCTYPDKYLAGVGVALKMVQALCRRTAAQLAAGFIKIAAIGTLADVVPLVGENRVIAKLGLDLLSRGPHKVGLRALLDVVRSRPARRSTVITFVSAGAADQRRRTHEHT
ncbi:MAG: DHH family phosphoesterase [Vicinamibacterales bacterium]